MNEEYNFYEFRAKIIKEMLESKYKSMGLENSIKYITQNNIIYNLKPTNNKFILSVSDQKSPIEFEQKEGLFLKTLFKFGGIIRESEINKSLYKDHLITDSTIKTIKSRISKKLILLKLHSRQL